MMELKQLGNTGVMVPEIGLGTWKYRGGVEPLRRGIELGAYLIDTAEIYRTENVVGQAIQGMRERVFIATKVSGEHLRSDAVLRAADASLRLLGTEVIDLYQIHWPPDPDSTELEEGWSTLAALKKEGKLRWIGVSNFSVHQMQRAQVIAPITSLQPPYSLVNREVEPEILPYCEQQNIGVIVYSPMASGLLTGAMTRDRAAKLGSGDWRSRNANFNEPKLSQNLALVEELRAIGKGYGRSAGEVAIAWTLLNPAVTGAIVGARSAKQADGVMRSGDLVLTSQDVHEIEASLSRAAA